MPGPAPEELAWLQALDTLSSRARKATLGDELESWEPPTNAGPIPAHLIPLARSIITDQAHANVTLKARMAELRGHGKVIKNLTSGGRPAPVYLDRVG